MKQALITRFFYDDPELFNERAIMFRDIVIPCLKGQINQNFQLIVLMDNFINELTEILDYPFITFDDYIKCLDYCKSNGHDLQTRLDSDDWISPEYVDICQREWANSDVDNLLIHFNFVKMDYLTKEVMPSPPPAEGYTSSFITLCQKVIKYSAYQRSHLKMSEVADKVIQVPQGHAIYYQHPTNMGKLINKKVPIRTK